MYTDCDSSIQPPLQVQVLDHGFHRLSDPQTEERGCKPPAVAIQPHPLADQVSTVLNPAKKTNKCAVDTRAVHVTAHGGHVDARLNARLEALFCQGKESFLQELVGQRGLVVESQKMGAVGRRQGSKGFVGGMGNE